MFGSRVERNAASRGILGVSTLVLALSLTALLPTAGATPAGAAGSSGGFGAQVGPDSELAAPAPFLSDAPAFVPLLLPTFEQVPPQVLTSLSVGSGPVTSVFDAANGYVYVANEVSNNVSVLSGSTVVANIALSSGNVTVGDPTYEVYDPGNGYVYVVDRYLFETPGGGVSILDGTSLVTTLAVGRLPSAAAYDSATGDVYVTESGANKVAVLSGTTFVSNLVTGTAPGAVAFDASNGYVYVADHGAASLSVFNGAVLVATVAVGGQPDALAVDASTGAVYVANNETGNVTVVDGLFTIGNVPTGANPSFVLYAPSNGDVYVSNANASGVSVINGTTLVADVATGAGPGGSTFDASTDLVYVADLGASEVTVIDGTSDLGNVSVGTSPSSDVYDSATGNVYVTNSDSHNVSIVATAYAVVFNETGLPGGSAWSVALGPQTRTTTTASLVFGKLPGAYPYTPSGPAGYRVVASVPASPVTVVDAPVVVGVAFGPVSNATYDLTFVESGLSGMCGRSTEWSVTVGNETRSTTTDSIQFVEPNGTYAYSAAGPTGYTVTSASPASPVTIAGAPVTVSLTFGKGSSGPTTYRLTFSESGLRWGTTWCVNVGAASYCSSRGEIVLSGLSSGTYSFTVSPVSGYSASPSSGTVTITDRDRTVDIRFSTQGSGHHCGGGGGWLPTEFGSRVE
ncbi:MAG TPA: YncE family protein [Thermoplasmata archaeon]|nr:YncE family protein [Thermoplasmata archaeon]